MTKRTAENSEAGPRMLDVLNDLGRCATCPNVCGVDMKPVPVRDDSRRADDCADLRRGGVSERMSTPTPQGYTTYHEGYAVCGRDEVATSYGVFDRRVTWRQVGRQILREGQILQAGREILRAAGTRLLEGMAMAGAMDRGNWVAVESNAVGSYVLPPEQSAPPVADAGGPPTA